MYGCTLLTGVQIGNGGVIFFLSTVIFIWVTNTIKIFQEMA